MIWFLVAHAEPAPAPPTIPFAAQSYDEPAPKPGVSEVPPTSPTSPSDSTPAAEPAPVAPATVPPNGRAPGVPQAPPLMIQSPFHDLVPGAGARGIRAALGFGLAAALFGLLAAVLQQLGRRLRPSGVLPTTLRVFELVARTLVAIFGLGVVSAMVPAFLAPAIPVVILAGAVAVGWSARDVIADLIAGLFMGVEGQLRAGYWIQGERYAGTVETIGLRVTWLRDVHGRRIIVPNRVLLAQPLVADDSPWPRIQFTVSLPDGTPSIVRSALDEAILLSPWVAPDADIEVHPDATKPGLWQVSVRLLDGKYADRFQGNLRERVEEILAASR